MPFEDREPPAPVFLTSLIFLIFAATSLVVAARLFLPTGDEPHYLVITQSLATDHDISLLNNYQSRGYRIFYPGLLPKRTTVSGDQKRELPTFSIGVPLFLVPFYKIAIYLFPGFLVGFLRLVIATVGAIAVYHLVVIASAFSSSRIANAVVITGAALAPPLITYCSQFYPEIFAFLLLVICLRQWNEMEEHRSRTVLWLALIPGLLLWLHPKYLALAVLITGITVYRLHETFRFYGERKSRFLQLGYVILALTAIATFFFFLHSEYGSWSPNRIYGGWKKQVSLIELIRQEGATRIWIMIRMFFGFWIDQRFGLLPIAPFYVAFFPAVVWTFRNERAKVWPLLLLFVGHFFALCWGAPLGGFAPPARHLVVLLPLLLLMIVMVFPNWRSWQKLLFLCLQFASWIVTFLMLTHYRKIFSNVTWRNMDQASDFWNYFGIDRWIPNVIATQPHYSLILFWVSIVALFALLLYPRKQVGVETLPDENEQQYLC